MNIAIQLFIQFDTFSSRFSHIKSVNKMAGKGSALSLLKILLRNERMIDRESEIFQRLVSNITILRSEYFVRSIFLVHLVFVL